MRARLLVAVVLALGVAVNTACGQGKPMVSVTDLHLEHEPRPLPFDAEELFATALDGRLHVIARDSRRQLRHFAIDAQGGVLPLDELPLASATGIVACDRTLVVTGWSPDSVPMVLRLSPDGASVAATKIAAVPPLHVWPRPICIGRVAWQIWTSGDPATVYMAEATGGAPHAIAFADGTEQLDAVGDDGGAWVARVHGLDRRLALSRIVDGKIVSERDVGATRPNAPSLARAGNGVALAWVEPPSRARVLLFDARSSPETAASVLDFPPAAGPLDGARVVGAGDGALALVAWSRAIVGDAETVRSPDGTSAEVGPRRVTRLGVAAYSAHTHQFGRLHPLEPNQSVHAAAWVNDVLVVVHGGLETGAQLSAFARAAR